jgi:hypothetical protein
MLGASVGEQLALDGAEESLGIIRGRGLRISIAGTGAVKAFVFEERIGMNMSLMGRVISQPRTELRFCGESVNQERAAFWRINGYRARLLVWTRDEWERMDSPPSDAQLHPAGVWCALRLD